MNDRPRHVLIHRLVTGATILFLASALLAPPAHAAPTWTPVGDLSAAGQSGYGAQVAVDLAGNATAVWQQAVGADDLIQTATRPAGGTWSAPTNLTSLGQSAAPDIAVDAAGNATAVWEGSNGTHSIIRTATRPRGGAWSGATDLSAEGQNANLPQVALGADGSATVVWFRSNGAYDVIQAATRAAGGSWSAPTTVSVTGRNAYGPQVVVDSSGSTTVVWRRQNELDFDRLVIQASTRPAGGTWSVPTNVSAAGGSANTPRIDLDPAGNITAVWDWWNGSNYIVQAAFRPAGGTWSASSDLTAPGQSARDAAVAVDAAGNATAVWYRSNGSHNVIQAATRPVGGAWSAPTSLSAPGQDARDPRIVVDPHGNATSIWRRNDGTHSIVQAARRPAGGVWSAATDLSAPGQDSFAPELAVDDAGNAIAVWARDDGAQSIIQARGLDAVGPTVSSLAIPATAVAETPVAFSIGAADTWSTVTSTTWDFGDGGTASGASVTHTYASAGTRTVTVTLADAVGNTTQRTGVVAVAPPAVVAPEITGLKLKPKHLEINGPKRKTRTTLVVRLSEDARVTVTVKRKGATGKQARQKVVLRKGLDAGRSKLRLTSKQLKRKLGTRFEPGRYKLTVKASNTAGRDKRSITLRVRR